MRFRDRRHAGEVLAERLRGDYAGTPGLLVLGLPRGGVPVAIEVARALDAPVTAVDVERVNARGLRLGAATADGPPYLRPDHDVPQADVEAALARARRAAQVLESRHELEREPVSAWVCGASPRATVKSKNLSGLSFMFNQLNNVSSDSVELIQSRSKRGHGRCGWSKTFGECFADCFDSFESTYQFARPA